MEQARGSLRRCACEALGLPNNRPLRENPELHNGRYHRGPSTEDWAAQAQLNVVGYAIDKQQVNRFRRKGLFSQEKDYYPWNTAACRW